MYLEFVLLRLEVADGLLPVRSQDILVLTGQTLVNLSRRMMSVVLMTAPGTL